MVLYLRMLWMMIVHVVNAIVKVRDLLFLGCRAYVIVVELFCTFILKFFKNTGS